MLLEDSWGIVMSMNMKVRLFDEDSKYKPYAVNGITEKEQIEALKAAWANRRQKNSDNGEKGYIGPYEHESAVSGSTDSADDAFKADMGTRLSTRAQF
jgi:hypothetical protein